MELENSEGQLELFDLSHHAAPRPHRESLGRILVHLRYDQVILAGVAGILGVTVIFACGVERGKQLVKAERMTVVREQPPPSSHNSHDDAATPSASDAAPSAKTVEQKPSGSPTTAPKVKTPTKLASGPSGTTAGVSVTQKDTSARTPTGKSRYAIQVVSYSRPQLAKQAMDRLRAHGERTFLVIHEGRTTVYVGPFPSKSNASQRLPTLKTQYQDCFVRTI